MATERYNIAVGFAVEASRPRALGAVDMNGEFRRRQRQINRVKTERVGDRIGETPMDEMKSTTAIRANNLSQVASAGRDHLSNAGSIGTR